MNTTTMTSATTLAVSFTDRAYVLSHGKAPRGRGAWAFLVSGTELPLIWANGTYAEAKAAAKAQARELHAAGAIPACVRSVTLAAQP